MKTNSAGGAGGFFKSLHAQYVLVAGLALGLGPATAALDPFLGSAGPSSLVMENLAGFRDRLEAGDPSVESHKVLEGPKGICTADFDRDDFQDIAVANIDGTVTVYYGRGDGTFDAPWHVWTGSRQLRDVIAADWTSDGLPDLITVSPFGGVAVLLISQPGRGFVLGGAIFVGRSARNLVPGDFNGDDRMDFAVGGALIGVEVYVGDGQGGFVSNGRIADLAYLKPIEFPKPVYSLQARSFAGAERDSLVVTHAEADRVWILDLLTSGGLAITGEIEVHPGRAHALDVGSVLHANENSAAAPDLVVAEKFAGTVTIHAGVAGPDHFATVPAQTLRIPGGPRAVRIVDLDLDGWNDLLVVVRNFDCIKVYRNDHGTLVADSELPVGVSPREMVTADFNGDNLADAAIMNRTSQDVSVLLNYPDAFGFEQHELVYPMCGVVAGLRVEDLNGDGRDDVLQLHRASDDFSVWLARADGSLKDPVYYPMGMLPNSMVVRDVDHDGIRDVVTVNMGRSGLELGSVSIRLGLGDGTFGPQRKVPLPHGIVGRLFALVAADFDGDGIEDLAAGFFDCRLAFFRGEPDGGFTYTHTHFFVGESRVMTVGDFDQDGDLDLAGAGYAGHVVVVENRGDLLDTLELTRQDYPPPSGDKFGTREIAAVDLNGDGDLDLVIGSGDGVMVYQGEPGMGFHLESELLAGNEFSISGAVTANITGDNQDELVVTSRSESCLKVLSVPDSDRPAEVLLNVDVPSGVYLARGDLDGDGLLDLVGAGGALWTALSSRVGTYGAPVGLLSRRPGITNRLVINEFLARNDLFPVVQDEGRKSDWVEIFNHTGQAISLDQWRLQWNDRADPPAGTNVYRFPSGAVIAHGAHLVLVCENNIRSPFHTGFKLPGAGGVLCLLNPDGEIVDELVYGDQFDNVSFGRYSDASHALAFNPYPSPGLPNVDNGPIEAVIDFEGFDPATLQPEQPITFYAQGYHDAGIVSLSLVFKRLDLPELKEKRVMLFDDGLNGDGASGDGWFAGRLIPGLPAGAEIEFYIEAVDLNEQVVIKPDDGIFSRPGEPVALHSLAISPIEATLEISEVLAWNKDGLVDEGGGTPPWVEIRNGGPVAIDLEGVGLSRNFFADSSRYVFPSGEVLAPGGYRVLFADDNPDQGPAHTPFELDRGGEDLWLTGLATHGARALIDRVDFGPQSSDVAWSRFGWQGPWRSAEPTPAGANIVAEGGEVMRLEDGRAMFGFGTIPGERYQVQYTFSLPVESWFSLPVIDGDGFEKIILQPHVNQRYYRLGRW